MIITQFITVFVSENMKFSALAIQCYQCQSTDLNHPFQCNEYLEDSDLQPSPCDSVYNAAFCIKQTGRFEGTLDIKLIVRIINFRINFLIHYKYLSYYSIFLNINVLINFMCNNERIVYLRMACLLLLYSFFVYL